MAGADGAVGHVPEPGVWWCQGSAPAPRTALTVLCPAAAEVEELVREEKLGLCPGVWQLPLQHQGSVTVTLAMAWGDRRAVTSGGAWVIVGAASQHCVAFLSFPGTDRSLEVSQLHDRDFCCSWQTGPVVPRRQLALLHAEPLSFTGSARCQPCRLCSCGYGEVAAAPVPAPAVPPRPHRALPLCLTVLSPAGCQTGEEGRSVGCARRPCTSLRRCSVKATASTSPASCAVSTTPSLTPSLLPGQGFLWISPNPQCSRNMDHPRTHGLSKLSGLTSASTHANSLSLLQGKARQYVSRC